jgi:hypothetical protein
MLCDNGTVVYYRRTVVYSIWGKIKYNSGTVVYNKITVMFSIWAK